MRGIPRLAVDRRLPVKDTNVTAADIADRNSICPWNPDMYGVDMSKRGAQAYYDSVFALFASWGVDFVEVADDISRPYFPQMPEIEAIRRAIDRSGRPMVLEPFTRRNAAPAQPITSSGTPICGASAMILGRMDHLTPQFARLNNWNEHRAEGAWPDADMLPFGLLDMGRRQTRFTPAEQRTCVTLWCIARSPLIMGGDLRALDEQTHALLTNAAVLDVNQNSANNRQLFRRDNAVGWIADAPGSSDKYLALFNLADAPASGGGRGA